MRYAQKILELINSSTAHMTAEQIFFELKKSEPKVVLASVYNNLNYLYGKGLIRKLSFDGSPDRYDKTVKHDHLICRKCRKLSDFTFGDMTKGLQAQLKGEILGYDLKVFYLCPECANKEKT